MVQTDSVSWEQAERWEGGSEEWVGNRCLSGEEGAHGCWEERVGWMRLSASEAEQVGECLGIHISVALGWVSGFHESQVKDIGFRRTRGGCYREGPRACLPLYFLDLFTRSRG